MFIQYFNWAILSEKSCKKRGIPKKYKKGGGWSYGSLSIEGGFKPSEHYALRKL